MSNNPYSTAMPRTWNPQEDPRPAPEVKRAYNRFTSLHSKMVRWHKKGQFHKVKWKMPEWEARNRAAWNMGLDVPDEFSTEGTYPKLRFRR